MIIIELVPGGLASQMKSYAFYRKFKEIYSDVKLDINYFLDVDPKKYKVRGLHNGYELENVFGLKPELATKEEIFPLKDASPKLTQKLRRRILGRKPTHFVEEYLKYYPDIFNLRNKYLTGYWPTPRYFEDIKTILLKEFKFRDFLDQKNLALLKLISTNETVAVHIRRGDYLNNPFHGGICDINYYKRSIELISKKLIKPVFIFFSDDPEWVRKQAFFNVDSLIVDWNLGGKNSNDMHLMSLCKHQILANSGFGWWSAWLNQNENKIVINPMKWFNDHRYESSVFIPNDWICL